MRTVKGSTKGEVDGVLQMALNTNPNRRRTQMKKVLISFMVLAFAAGFLATDGTAEAMNNESAAMLAGAIAIFGKPVLQAVAGEILPVRPAGTVYHPAPDPYPAVSVVTHHHNRNDYRWCDKWRSAYEKGWCSEWQRNEYRRGRHDARETYREEYH